MYDHNEYLKMYAAVLASPGDLLPRQIMRDWLLDHDRPEYADIITASLEMDELESSSEIWPLIRPRGIVNIDRQKYITFPYHHDLYIRTMANYRRVMVECKIPNAIIIAGVQITDATHNDTHTYRGYLVPIPEISQQWYNKLKIVEPWLRLAKYVCPRGRYKLRFHNGFLDELWITPDEWRRLHEQLRERFPIRELHILYSVEAELYELPYYNDMLIYAQNGAGYSQMSTNGYTIKFLPQSYYQLAENFLVKRVDF